MSVALADWPPYRPLALELIEQSLRNGKLVDGPNTAALEASWKEQTGAAYCLSCSSGTAALYLALAALGIEGREVIIPAFTFSGSVFPVIMAGGIPVYADIDPLTYCLTAETVQRVLSPRTAVVLPVHIHGYPADLEAIAAVLPDGVRMIEDACQAAGSTLADGRRAGRFGLAGGFSLNQTKALPGGEGGLAITDDGDFFKRMHTLRRFGENWDNISKRTYMVEDRWAGNYRIDELCAAVALSHVPYLDEITESARRNAQVLIDELVGLPGLRLPTATPGHSWQKFRLRVTDAAMRERMMERLEEFMVPVCQWQVAVMPDHPGFHDPNADVPEARRMLEDSFLLFTERNPLHWQSEDSVRTIAQRIRQAWPA